MANYEQAPKLSFDSEKKLGNNFYAIPQDLADIVFNKLGNASAQLRIMMVLIGTKEGFAISDKWICERTGLLHPSYNKARQELVKRGWLTHNPSKGITVNFQTIYAEGSNTILPQKENDNTILHQNSNTILHHESNTILPQSSNTTLHITDKKTDNFTNKKTDTRESFEANASKSSLTKTPGGPKQNWVNLAMENFNF